MSIDHLLIFGLAIVLFSSFAVGQPSDTPDQPDNVPESPESSIIPDLPGDAADTAKEALNSISTAFSNTAGSIGETLSDLLGSGQGTNQTE